MPWNSLGTTFIGLPTAPQNKILPISVGSSIILRGKLPTQTQDGDIGIWICLSSSANTERSEEKLIYFNDDFDRVFNITVPSRSGVTFNRLSIRANFRLNTSNGLGVFSSFEYWS